MDEEEEEEDEDEEEEEEDEEEEGDELVLDEEEEDEEEEEEEEVEDEEEEEDDIEKVGARYGSRSRRQVPSASSRQPRQGRQRPVQQRGKRTLTELTSELESEASETVLRDNEEAEEEEDNDLETDYNETDYSRLTDRQRRRLMDETLELQELPNEGPKKKIFTEDELMLRRTETARRRKNLSAKRREEEKMDTINRLLKKQAPRRKGKLRSPVGSPGTPAADEESEAPVKAIIPERYSTTHMFRWVSSKNGIVLGIPESLVQ
ncbi:PAPA-1-like conserved region-domain-containing protein [Lipomyces kononenkoae]|uniref:PAPA-1-like conserved region-domain-containing protein n=1 Tax=Lipomyces kononenkoae TaxID=34357 RepID=A0ACC3TCZ8_LIPKO